MVRFTAWVVLVLGALFVVGGILGAARMVDEGETGGAAVRLALVAVIALAMVRAGAMLRRQ